MGNDRKLGWAIFISIVLHFLILILAVEFAPWKILKAGKKEPLVVHLNNISTKAAQRNVYSREKQKEKTTAIKKTDSEHNLSIKKRPDDLAPNKPEEVVVPAKSQEPLKVVDNQTPVAESSSTDNSGNQQAAEFGRWQAEYAKKLRDIIREKQRYPIMAMRNRHQGTVMVGFILSRAGKLIECHITQPCKHKILNRAALRAVESVKKFPPFPNSVPWDQAGFVVPVTFSLKQ